MIEELKLIISLLDGVAGISANLVYAFLALKGLGALLTTGAVVYVIRLVVMAIAGHCKAGITRQEADSIQKAYSGLQDDKATLTSKMANQNQEHHIELEKIKHLYKILKEAKDVG